MQAPLSGWPLQFPLHSAERDTAESFARLLDEKGVLSGLMFPVRLPPQAVTYSSEEGAEMHFRSFGAVGWTIFSIGLQGSGAIQPQSNGTVSGVVRYGDSGKPAAGVRLWLVPASNPAGVLPDPKTGEYEVKDGGGERVTPTLVAADGSFALTGVPPGIYLVRTYSPPYLSPDDTVYPTSNTAHTAVGELPSSKALQVEVNRNQATKPLMVLLQRGGAIDGSVRLAASQTGASGSPLAGLAVSAERKLGPNAYARVGGAAHTDAQGRYELNGLAAGDYIVFVGMGGNLPVYSPGTVRPSKAAVIHLQGPVTRHLDIVLPSSAGHRIDGSVQIEESEPVQNALVRLYPTGEGGLTAATRLTATRSFTFEGVPDGEYTIAVEISPSPKLVSIDTAKGIMHMRMVPSPFTDSTQDIRVTGDVTAVLLTVHRR